MHGHLRLRQQLARSRELRERLALGTNHFHHAQRSHNAVARALDIAKDRMARLLAAQAVAALAHLGIHVTVAHAAGHGAQTGKLQRLDQAKVAGNRRHHGTARESPVLVQIHAAHVQDLVAVYHATALIHGQAAVGIAVVGKAHVQPLLHHVALQALHMRGATVDVDVKTIGRGIDHAHVGAERVKHRLGHRGSRAVGAVNTDLDALQRKVRAGDERSNVAVAALHVVHRGADVIARCQRHLALAIDVVLDELQHVLVHLKAVAVDELNAVIAKRVVARADHDAAIEAALHGLMCHARRRDHMQHIGVHTARDQAAHQRRLEHITRATRVLAHDHARLALAVGAVIPAHKTANLISVLYRQPNVGLTAKTVGAKVLHALSLQNRGGQIACPPQNGTRLSALPEKPYADALSRAAWHVGV